jgi:hypothetical protein
MELLGKAAKLMAWVDTEASKGDAAGLATGGPPGAQALEQLLPAWPEPSRPLLREDKGQKRGKAGPPTPLAAAKKPQSTCSSSEPGAAAAAAAAGADGGSSSAGTAEQHKAALEAQQLRVIALLMGARVAHLQWQHSRGLALALAALQAVPEQLAAARRAQEQLSPDELELLKPSPTTWALAAEQVASAYSQLQHHERCLEMATTTMRQCASAGEWQKEASARRPALANSIDDPLAVHTHSSHCCR